jgi:replicative DNA helicase
MLGGGLRKQDLVVLAGDIASGRSALALAMAVRATQAGVPVLFLSGEMEEQRLLERAVAFEARVAIDDLRQGRLDDAPRAAVGGAALKLRGTRLALRPMLGRSFDEITEALRLVPRPELVIIDGLRHMAPPRDSARSDERIARSARALKAIALEYDTAVLAVADTPALRAGRVDMRPTLDDLGGAGAVKQHADVVLGLYREEMYLPGSGVEGAAELLVRKNRNGPTGFVDLYFYARWLRFEDMLDPEP